jgi:molecular chaperone DnaK
METEVSVDIALEDSGLSPRDIDKVLLVGGSTRIPAVVDFIEKKMNMKPSCELNPDEAVAIGAAIYAKSFTGAPSSAGWEENSRGRGGQSPAGEKNGGAKSEKSSIFTDVNSHGLGVVSNNECNIAVNTIIIPRNQPIPTAAAQDFVTIVDNQQLVELQVTEGDDEDLAYVTIIGTAEIQLRPHPKGSPVRVELGYDSNGIITGRLYDLVDNIYCGEIVIKREENISEEELKNKAELIKRENLQ